MKVIELINWLKDFDEDMEIVIGMQQRYGSDFAMKIDDVSVENVSDWDYGNNKTVVITKGSQIGIVKY